MRTTSRRIAAFTLFVAGGCDYYACAVKTDPPEPFPVTHLETAYDTEDGRFTIVLHSDDAWPPTVGTAEFEIEWIPTDLDPPASPHVEVDPPFLADMDRVADDTPSVEPVDDRTWRVTNVTFDLTGEWILPVVISQAEVVDTIELGFIVEAP